MWVLKQGDTDSEYEIGYYRASGNFFILWTCTDFTEAVRIVNFMNGGSGALPEGIFSE